MPIKGLSERTRLPRIGKIHLGIKGKKKKGDKEVEYPIATDYFVCPPEVQAVYGEKPKALDIIIPVEDDEMWCNQYYRRYSWTRGLICKGDGETCQRMVDEETGDIANQTSKSVVWKRDLPCQGRLCPFYLSKPQLCQEVMNLQFLLPKVPGLGIWQIDTGSIHSIRNINDFATMMRATCGQVGWVKLKLLLVPDEANDPDTGKKKTIHVLKLNYEGNLLELVTASNKPKHELLITAPAEDEAPRDVIEVEPPKADSKKAEKDTQDLWPKPEPDPSLKTTLEATKSISSPLKAVTGSEEPAEAWPNGIIWPDLAKLIEALRQADPKFTDSYIGDRLAKDYKVQADTIKIQCEALSPTDAKRFTGSVQSALLKAKMKKEV